MILNKWNKESYPRESTVFFNLFMVTFPVCSYKKNNQLTCQLILRAVIPECTASNCIRRNLMLNYICKPSLMCWSGTIKQLIFCTIPETTMSRYFIPWTASYVRLPPSLFSVMSISSWSLDWTSGCVASWCVAKHKSVEAVSKPARKKSTTCAAKSSSSHSVLRTQDSNSDKHVGYEKRM